MKTAMDHYMRKVGLKEPNRRKPILYWQVWFGNAIVDESIYIGMLKEKWRGYKVKFKDVR